MSARIPDTNGWYEIRANPLTQAGVYDYLGSSIKAGDPNKTYRVLRPAEELSKPETLNSFRLLPFIDNHAMLGNNPTTGDRYMAAEVKGVHGTTGDMIYFDPADGIVYGNLKIWSESQDRKIASGKRDISMGYKCKYDWTPGVHPQFGPFDCVQRNIRGNHSANVQDGRMGSHVAVMDEADIASKLVATFDEKDVIVVDAVIKPARERNPDAFKAALKKVVSAYGAKVKDRLKAGTVVATMDAADTTALSSDTSISDIADFLGEVMPMISDINDSMVTGNGGDPDDDSMEAVMDAATGKPVMGDDGKPKMQKKKVTPATPATATGATATMDSAEFIAAMDSAITKAVTAAVGPLNQQIAELKASGPSVVLSEIAKRDELASKLSGFVGTFDSKEMTLQAVAKYGVDKLGIPNVTAGQEVSSVTAYLHGRTPQRPAFGGPVATMDGKEPRKSSVKAYMAEEVK